MYSAATSTVVGDVASYSCVQDYYLHDRSNSTNITCLNSGEWSNVTTTCHSEYGQAIYLLITLIKLVVQPIDFKWSMLLRPFRKLIEMKLDFYYEIYCKQTLFLRSHLWYTLCTTIANFLHVEILCEGFLCVTEDCGRPSSLTNGRFHIPSDTLAGHVVLYSCDSGYSFPNSTDQMEITCQPDGHWQEIGQHCVGKWIIVTLTLLPD